MITIIHGDDFSKSRNYYLLIRQKVDNPVIFEGKKITLTLLMQCVDGSGLFSETKSIFIENFFLGKKSNEFTEIIIFIKKNSQMYQFYLWEDKSITKKDLSLLPVDSINVSFLLPSIIFTFLDNIKPNNIKNIDLFHKVLQIEEVQLIFSMLVSRFRLLLTIKDEIPEQINELKRLQPWQKIKIRKQSQYFSPKYLIEVYRKLAIIDSDIKIGTNSLSLSQSIDFFLLSL
ncbi:MAG: hypothetical protein EXS44_01460 [Candidatus Levybacteria bacterium]|nr:hypothetical protein [Candidatus Levybacteria bacterium]